MSLKILSRMHLFFHLDSLATNQLLVVLYLSRKTGQLAQPYCKNIFENH